jgi:hypothetical protein
MPGVDEFAGVGHPFRDERVNVAGDAHRPGFYLLAP